MKLKILSLVAAVAVLVSCGPSYRVTDGSTVTTLNVPAGIQTSFVTQYPNATAVVWTSYDEAMLPIDWELTGWPAMDPGDYLVRFDMNNEKYYAWYDSNGDWVGTAYVINDYKTLPDAVTNTLNTQFNGYTITAVNKELQKDRMAYEIQLKNGDSKVKLLVDSNGNIIKQKTKTQ
jgi:uncharacterized membrane protein YkoI